MSRHKSVTSWWEAIRHAIIHFLGGGGHSHGGESHHHQGSKWATPIVGLFIFNGLWPLAHTQTPEVPLSALYIVDLIACVGFIAILIKRRWR